MRILLTNDDGLNSNGMLEAERALTGFGEVWAVAPDRERSATSMGISLREPLRLIRDSDRRFMVTGFPVDCVNVCLFSEGFPEFDLVVSGINHGANLGDDVYYSGTVGAARHAALHGHRAIAMSALLSAQDDFRRPARWLAQWLSANLIHIQVGTVYNINYPQEVVQAPELPLPLWEVTRQGRRRYADVYVAIEEAEEYTTLRLADSELGHHVEEGTDFAALERGVVSVTPLQRDQTDHTEWERWQARTQRVAKS